jgi:probable O-glycosylation ligase (exosortase A-associated)
MNGVLMWVWISVMNPHTQSWGFARSFPFAYIIAIFTLLSIVKSSRPIRLPWTPETVVLLVFVLWMNVTTVFAFFPATAWIQWGKVMKIMLMTFVTLAVVRSRQDVHRLIWMLVISLGYYGVKGGIFTVRYAGNYRVWGPQGTFIDDNNAMALALIVTIPLMHYLYQSVSGRWARHAIAASMLLCAVAALGSYSRGALLAIVAMLAFLWLKASHKLVSGTLMAMCLPLLPLLMPERWFERMDTIGSYEQDSSAMGRVNAWHMAFNLACDRFLGGGYDIAEPLTFMLYAPNPRDIHAAHSIYFQALGEHGFIGLALYLLLGICSWRSASWVVKMARGRPELAWAGSLASMIQVSLLAFGVGGAFLSLLYFDVPYYLVAAVVALRLHVRTSLDAAQKRETAVKV